MIATKSGRKSVTAFWNGKFVSDFGCLRSITVEPSFLANVAAAQFDVADLEMQPLIELARS